MTVKEITEYIYSIPKFTKKNTPEEVKSFYDKLGRPGEKCKIIHVAGTNGKGSVCAYLAGILKEAGISTGLFTSPHLVTILERFCIDGEMISEELFCSAFEEVKKNITDMYHPTFFEFLFYMAMIIFEQENVSFIILETGLGGRLDATNVIAHKIATVITKIGLDHMEYLGNTVEQIAKEKAGIMKEGVPVIYFKQEKNVTSILENNAKRYHCQQFPVEIKGFNILKNTHKGIAFSFQSQYYNYIELELSTCALYQCDNVRLAVKTIEATELKSMVNGEQLQQGVLHTHWQGRMEEVARHVYVDGAHNEDGIEAFSETVKSFHKQGKNYLLFAVVNDKDYQKMIHCLMKDSIFDEVIITKISGNRELSPVVLESLFEKDMDIDHISICEDVETAWKKCRMQMKKEDYLYVAGSLYLVGMIKEILYKEQDRSCK